VQQHTIESCKLTCVCTTGGTKDRSDNRKDLTQVVSSALCNPQNNNNAKNKNPVDFPRNPRASNQLLLPKKSLKIRNTLNYPSTKTKRSSHCSNAWRACVRNSSPDRVPLFLFLCHLQIRQCRCSNSIYIFMCFGEYASVALPALCFSILWTAFSHLIRSTYRI
jgi:hypothetical protein